MPDLDLSSYLSDDTLKLHGIASTTWPDGHSYEVPSPSAIDGLKLRRLMNLSGDDPSKPLNADAAQALAEFCTDKDGNTVEFDAKLLGPARDAMIADGVSMDRLDQITRIVALNFGGGTELAQLVVEAAKGEAEARANRATRRAAAKKTRSTARKTAGSKSTPASTPTPARTRSPRATTRTSGRSSTSPKPRAAAS